MPTTRFDGESGNWEIVTPPDTENPQQVQFKYTPDGAENGCRNVFLVQTSKTVAYDEAGNKVTAKHEEMFRPGTDNPYRHRADDRIDDADGDPVSIDHLACEGDPFSNGGDYYQDVGHRGDATTNPPTATDGKDDPRTPFDNKRPNIKRTVVTLETCAVCADSGSILGCVRWQSSATPDNPGEPTLLSTKEEPPTETFGAALRKFMESHARARNGTTHWYCPDDKGLWIGPAATAEDDPFDEHVNDPWGRPMPDGWKRAWVDPPTPAPPAPAPTTPEPAPETPAPEPAPPGGEFMQLDPEQAGGGPRFRHLDEALAAALEDPARAVVKICWSGDQIKPIRGVVFAARADLAPDELGRFVERTRTFSNDFTIGFGVIALDSGTLAELLRGLQRVRESSGSAGAIAVTVIAKLRTPAAAAHTVQLTTSQLGAVLAGLQIAQPPTDELRMALRYVANNMAAPPDERRGAQ